VTTSASTNITSGGSGIAAVNKATSADPANPSVVVPSTSDVSVLAFGTIHSGTILAGSGDPAAGILAGYNPNNTDTANNGVHGDVSVDDYASIVAAAGTRTMKPRPTPMRPTANLVGAVGWRCPRA
jgi:hypothetical protein